MGQTPSVCTPTPCVGLPAEGRSGAGHGPGGYPTNVARVVFCSGKLSSIACSPRAAIAKSIMFALIRVEQLYPFRRSGRATAWNLRPPRADVVWAQEEPRNMGPWASCAKP